MAIEKSDWKTSPMPSEKTKISIEANYSEEEMNQIKEGFKPKEMEDKWFIYFDKPWLYLHRSWTGYCIYMVKIENGTVTETWVNGDKEQYNGTHVDNVQLVKDIINYKLLKKTGT